MNGLGQLGRKGGIACAIVPAALAGVLLAGAADARKRRVSPQPPIAMLSPGFGAFTPAAADPRLAAAFARNGLGTENFSGGAFRFTPSGTSNRRAITIAVRARGTARPSGTTAELAPSAYSLGMSVGWRRFALSGDFARTDGGLLPESHESADVGFSFLGKRWSTKVDLAADRPTGDRAALGGIDQSWSLGLGGSYSLTRNLDVTGGLRYKTQRDELKTIADDRRDSQAVYFGTTYRF